MVKSATWITAIGAAVVGALLLAAPAGAKEKAKVGGAAVLTPAADVKWADVPGFEGVKLAVVEGDPAKGAHHSMMRFAAGFSAPVHKHSANHYVTVLAGTLVLGVDGVETKLPAGSYFAFTGKKLHTTRCDAGADCVLFVDARGKWDVIPEK
jgi:quercetin dioxygenase-like cupin family protein